MSLGVSHHNSNLSKRTSDQPEGGSIALRRSETSTCSLQSEFRCTCFGLCVECSRCVVMTYGLPPSVLCDITSNVNNSPVDPRDWSRTPPQLHEGVCAFLALARAHPHMPPAVLAAVMASPADQRRRLLEEAARQCGREGGFYSSPHSSPSSSSDEVWEDAVEDLETERETADASRPTPTMAMASIVTEPQAEVALLEREAVECHRRWQSTRQLGFWTRYNECRARIAALRGGLLGRGLGRGLASGLAIGISEEQEEHERMMRANRWSQLQAQREQHERRLAELGRRRERLRWTRQYDEQTRLFHSQLARRQLQDEIQQLDERAQLRRLEHTKRLQQLQLELSADDELERVQSVKKAKTAVVAATSADDELERVQSTKKAKTAVVAATSADDELERVQSAKKAKTAVVEAAELSPKAAPEDEFTHIWDDFIHWEKMVNDDKENVAAASPTKGPLTWSLPQLSSPIAVRAAEPARAASVPNVPSVPSVPGQAALWRTDCAPRISFEERKKWFEEALLAWHAQDDEEDFGTSQYSCQGGIGTSQYARQGVIGHSRSLPASSESTGQAQAQGPMWFHAAWSAWQGPAILLH